MRHIARLACLARGHVVQHILHRPAVWQGALPHLSCVACVLLLPISSLTLVSMEQEDKLLLDELPLLRIS